jgi:hypothetical protein
MTGEPTPHLIAQASRIAELLDRGYTQNQMGELLGVSGPRIAEIKRVLPRLRPYLGNPEPTERLRSQRDQLWALRREALTLAATIRRDLRELDEELQSARIDGILGHRLWRGT